MSQTLGKRVAQDRQRLGLTQAGLAPVLYKNGGGRWRSESAARTWLAKLEGGRWIAKVDEADRRLLAAALRADKDIETYLVLPIQGSDDELLDADGLGKTGFEELWTFTKQPLEFRVPTFAQSIVAGMTDNAGKIMDRPLIFFVPDERTAGLLLLTYRHAVAHLSDGGEIIRQNLRIELVGSALAFMPHTIVRFRSQRGQPPEFEGRVELHAANDGTRLLARMITDDVNDIVNVLKWAGLLDADHRYRRLDQAVHEGPDRFSCKPFCHPLVALAQ